MLPTTPLPAPPKPKAKKAEPKLDVGRPKVEDKPKAKKPPPKVRVTEAKPKVREDIQIDIPEIINIPGIGQIELPKAKPKPKPKAKAKPKAKPKPKPKTPKATETGKDRVRAASDRLARSGMKGDKKDESPKE